MLCRHGLLEMLGGSAGGWDKFLRCAGGRTERCLRHLCLSHSEKLGFELRFRGCRDVEIIHNISYVASNITTQILII